MGLYIYTTYTPKYIHPLTLSYFNIDINLIIFLSELFRQKLFKMSQGKLAMTAAAGVGVIGAMIFSMRKPTKGIDDAERKRYKAQEMRESGLGSAGTGGIRMIGGPTSVAASSGPDKDTENHQAVAARPKEERSSSKPGNSGSRKTEQSGWADSVLHTMSKSTGSRGDLEGIRDTRGISKMGSEIPSKRGPAAASD